VSVPQTAGRTYGLLAISGGAFFIVPGLWARHELLAAGYAGPGSSVRALVLALALELVWLPLLGAVYLERRFGGTREMLVAAGGGLVAGLGFAAHGGLSLAEVVWAQALVAAFAILVLAAARVPLALGFSPTLGRVRAGIVTLVLLSVPFWSQPLVNCCAPGPWKRLIHVLTTWFSPLLLVSVPFADFNLAVVGRLYGMVRGSELPLPSHPGLVIVTYGGLAAAAYGVAALIAEIRRGRAAPAAEAPGPSGA